MIDEIAIQQVLNAYSLCANRHDYDALAENYLAEGVWDVQLMEMRLVGRDQIAAKAREVSSKYEFMVQIHAPAAILVDGDEATAQSTVHETARICDSERTVQVFGHYDDRLKRTSEGWRFAERKFTLLAVGHADLKPGSGDRT